MPFNPKSTSSTALPFREPKRSCSAGPGDWPRFLPESGSGSPELMRSPEPSRPGSRNALTRPGSRGSGADLGERQIAIAGATRRENFIQEQYEQQLDQAQIGGLEKRRGSIDILRAYEAAAEVHGLIKPEDFLLETASLDHRIEDMSRNVRLEHFAADSKAEDRVQRARDDIKRQREAELRKARKSEQEARNPRRKVALKLENTRRFAAAALAQGDQEPLPLPRGRPIPMTKIEAEPGNLVDLVDVRKLRAGCKMLDEGGHSVEEMLDWEKRKEQEGLAKSMRATMSLQEFSSCATECTVDERLVRAKARYQQVHMDYILRKLASCRTNLPYMLPFSLDVEKGTRRKKAEVCADASESPEGLHSPPEPARRRAQVENPGPRSGSKGPPVEILEKAQRSESRKNTAVLEKASRSESRKGTANLSRRQRRRSSTASQRQELSKQVKQALMAYDRLRKLWAIAKAAAKVLALFASVLRKRDHVELVKRILRQLGEWARLRRSVRRLMDSVMMLQTTCRQYLEYKRRRCEQMQREWTKWEDNHLSNYFRSVTQKMIKEMKAQTKSMGDQVTATRSLRRSSARPRQSVAGLQVGKGDFIQMIEAGVDSGNLQIDWRSFRIPARDRWATINAYYVARLKKHVRCQGSFLTAVKAQVESEKEMVHFLQCFGANERTVKDFQRTVLTQEDKVKPTPFWHLSEEMVLKLIAITAQSLAAEKAFADHPANKDVEPWLRTALPGDGEAIRSSGVAGDRAIALVRILERQNWAVNLGRLRARPQRKALRSPSPPSRPVSKSNSLTTTTRVHIEDVFHQGFSPPSPPAWGSEQETRPGSKTTPQRGSVQRTTSMRRTASLIPASSTEPM